MNKKKKKKKSLMMALPTTPKKGGGSSTDVDNKETEELMTPGRRTHSETGYCSHVGDRNNEPIDVMRGRGIVTSMTLRAKAEGIKRVAGVDVHHHRRQVQV